MSTRAPSVGKAKASHAAPPDPKAKPQTTQEDSTQATSAGEPLQENEIKGTIIPKHALGHLDKYRITLDENINAEVVEHCVVDFPSLRIDRQNLLGDGWGKRAEVPRSHGPTQD